MGKRLAGLLAALPLAACLWLPPGAGARPRVGLEAVERTPATGTRLAARPAEEPGTRGWLFADSLIAFRTRANPAAIRFRLWNRATEPLRILRDSPAAAGECAEPAGAWELRETGLRAEPHVLAPGESWEGEAVPAVRVGPSAGAAPRTVGLACLVFDPAQPRAALRLGVERDGVRYDYTFWYRLAEPPREDPGALARRTAARPP